MEGNQQKMRDALNDIVDAIDTWCSDYLMEYWQYSRLFDIADDALAAQPRNCDLYDNKTDAETRFVEETGENDTSQHYWQMFANWLFSPAAARKEETRDTVGVWRKNVRSDSQRTQSDGTMGSI